MLFGPALKKQLPVGFLSLPQLPEYVQPQTADSERVNDVGMGSERAEQVVESGEEGEAVTVTVEVDVDGMESVDTVVVKVEVGAVVVSVVVVVDVWVGEVTAREQADERMVAGNLARAPGVEVASRFTMAADSVGSRWLG